MAGRLWVGDFSLPSTVSPLTRRAPVITSNNLAPRRPISTLRHETGHGVVLDQCFWGLTPPWLKVLDHAPHCARAESLFERPMFRDAIATRRCLIPVSGFYVWKPQPKRKQPFLVIQVQRRPLLLAGLWCRFEQQFTHYDSCALITVPSLPHLTPLTDRLPAVVAPHRARQWLSPDTPMDDVHQMLSCPFPEPLGAYPVTTLVNSPENQSMQCTHPTGPMLVDRHQESPDTP